MTPDYDKTGGEPAGDEITTAASRAVLHAVIAAHAAVCPQCQHAQEGHADGNPAGPVQRGGGTALTRAFARMSRRDGSARAALPSWAPRRTPRPARPRRSCPARRGEGTDAMTSPFRLDVHDGGRTQFGYMIAGYDAPISGPESTEILAFFVSDADSDDAVMAAELVIPHGSPVALLAARVAASPPAVEAMAAILHDSIAACPCEPGTAECPALDPARFLHALETADRQALPERNASHDHHPQPDRPRPPDRAVTVVPVAGADRPVRPGLRTLLRRVRAARRPRRDDRR